MDQAFTIVSKIVAKPGKADALKPVLQGLLTPSRNDDGCLLYDLHQSIEDPNVFLFYETWQSKAQWEKHMATPHLQALNAFFEAEDVVAQSELLQMQKI